MIYTIIGGINGVGKSTIYSTLSVNEKLVLGERVNVDEIASGIGDWRDVDVQFKAAKEAVSLINKNIKAGVTFHQESTLAGRTIINTIKVARKRGYAIHLWYIYVDNVLIAKQRVANRVANGGHGILHDIIDKRSLTSLKTLVEIIPLCDEIKIYNNTTILTIMGRIINNKIVYLDKSIPVHIKELI
jgi:predicted ABC-type ATPase